MIHEKKRIEIGIKKYILSVKVAKIMINNKRSLTWFLWRKGSMAQELKSFWKEALDKFILCIKYHSSWVNNAKMYPPKRERKQYWFQCYLGLFNRYCWVTSYTAQIHRIENGMDFEISSDRCVVHSAEPSPPVPVCQPTAVCQRLLRHLPSLRACGSHSSPHILGLRPEHRNQVVCVKPVP